MGSQSLCLLVLLFNFFSSLLVIAGNTPVEKRESSCSLSSHLHSFTPSLPPSLDLFLSLWIFLTLSSKSLQSSLTLWDPMDCSPPGSSVHEILQARILEWVAMPSSRGSSWPGIRLVSLVSPALAGRFPLCMIVLVLPSHHPSARKIRERILDALLATVRTYMASVRGLQGSLWDHHGNLISHLSSPPPGDCVLQRHLVVTLSWSWPMISML